MKKFQLILVFALGCAFGGRAQEVSTVDVLPTNIGGKEEFKRVFEQEMVYPIPSFNKKIGGKEVISFLLKKDSTIQDINIDNSLSKDIDAEALRLLMLYQWIPGLKSGKYVNSIWSVTFDFNPDKYSKICKTRGFTKFKYLPKMKVDSTCKVYTNPEQFPMYPKGNFALQDFIKENLEYPRQAQLTNIQGTVVLRFVVEPSGLMTNIGIQKSVGGGCDQEALRLLKMINWYPGKYDSKLVRVQMTFPFYFILNEEFKDNSSGEQK